MRYEGKFEILLWVKTNGIPFRVFRCTTHFRTAYFSGWIESDVHWGLTDLAFGSWSYEGVGATLSGVFVFVSWGASRSRRTSWPRSSLQLGA